MTFFSSHLSGIFNFTSSLSINSLTLFSSHFWTISWLITSICSLTSLTSFSSLTTFLVNVPINFPISVTFLLQNLQYHGLSSAPLESALSCTITSYLASSTLEHPMCSHSSHASHFSALSCFLQLRPHSLHLGNIFVFFLNFLILFLVLRCNLYFTNISYCFNPYLFFICLPTIFFTITLTKPNLSPNHFSYFIVLYIFNFRIDHARKIAK